MSKQEHHLDKSIVKNSVHPKFFLVCKLKLKKMRFRIEKELPEEETMQKKILKNRTDCIVKLKGNGNDAKQFSQLFLENSDIGSQTRQNS